MRTTTSAGLTTRDATPELLRALKALGDRAVMVGVPSDDEQPHRAPGEVGTNRREDDGGTGVPEMNNATLGFIHEHGAPEVGIPARPHLVRGVETMRSRIVSRLLAAGRAALRGDEDAVDRYLDALGIEAVSSVRRTLQEGVPPPLKDSTVRNRRRRSKGSKYRRKATSASDATPLIDTGAYLSSISYVRRGNRGR